MADLDVNATYLLLMQQIPVEKHGDLRTVIVHILNTIHGLYEENEDANGEDDRLIGALVSHHMFVMEIG